MKSALTKHNWIVVYSKLHHFDKTTKLHHKFYRNMTKDELKNKIKEYCASKSTKYDTIKAIHIIQEQSSRKIRIELTDDQLEVILALIDLHQNPNEDDHGYDEKTGEIYEACKNSNRVQLQKFLKDRLDFNNKKMNFF